jgi:putative phosphoesterase
MKIALFSDIHANLPAMEAVFSDLEKRKPDAVYCLGDLVGYNVWPNEVVQEIRRRGIPCIAGNYDHGVGRNLDDCGCAYKVDTDKALGAISINLTNQWMRNEERAYLRSLPEHIRLTFNLHEEALSVLMVHGSPRRINEYLFEDREEKSLLRMMEEYDSDLLFFGHTHKPFHKAMACVKDGKTAYRHAVNTGSAGKPKDADPRACYVLVTIDEHSSVFEKESITVEFVRVAYDVEKAARAVEESELPDKFAEMLRRGV